MSENTLNASSSWQSKKNTMTLILDFVEKIKYLILTYFSPIVIWLFLFWLYNSSFFWTVYDKIYNANLWSWTGILVVLISLLVIAAYIFAWLWVFNAADNEESISAFIKWLKNDKSLSLWVTSAITTQIVYFLILGIFVMFWYFIWYNIWEIFIKILAITKAAFNIWIFHSIFWKDILSILFGMWLFLVVVWVVPLMAQAANMFRAKVQAWAGMSRGILWLLAWIMIIAIASTVTGMKLVNSNNVTWELQKTIKSLDLTK